MIKIPFLFTKNIDSLNLGTINFTKSIPVAFYIKKSRNT
jgi:hypothetical protein